MTYFNQVSELIGNTPLLKLNNYILNHQIKANIFAKIESFNPTGSIKDRIVKAMIIKAKQDGLIKSNSFIIEPTSGNTGIALASICAALNYQLILTMPDSTSIERRNLVKTYGAKVVLTPGNLGMDGAIDKANELANQLDNVYMLSQFENINNPNIHYLTTGPEIHQQLDGIVDILVAGVGTGGTISGVGKYLKEQNSNLKIVAIEPVGSPILSKGKPGPHKIQGIGAGFIPNTLDNNIYDEVIAVSSKQAIEKSQEIARSEGILVGVSSGAALYGATVLAKRQENKGKSIVVIFPDIGDRYLDLISNYAE